MQRESSFLNFLVPGVLAVGILSTGWEGFAQTKPSIMSDAQVEANVLKALAGAPELADQAIATTTVYGTVTLSGSVRDETSRNTAEKLVSNAAGVQKVVDELTIGAGPAVATSTTLDQQVSNEGTNPNLQSDGTIAPQTERAQNDPNSRSNQDSGAPMPGQTPSSVSSVPQDRVTQQAGQFPPDGPQYRRPYDRPNGPPNTSYPQRPYVEQRGGDAVVVPSGTMLRVRVNEGMDSRHTPPGTVFDGVVLNDVVAGGAIAVPRGAAVLGTVVDVHSPGQLKGSGGLSLKLTQVTLGGRTYPLVSDVWGQQGVDKTGQTVENAVGLGAVGAVIGAVAGGGPGAAIGAGVGGVAGLGVSSASGRGEAMVPSEAILTFHLIQATELTTVSQAELNRLGSGVPIASQPQMRRRYPPPPPPPYYYGPVYYPRY